MRLDPAAAPTFAPAGALRASINLGNPLLARAGPAGGPPRGVSVDLAREAARRLGVEVEFLVFDTANQSVEAVRAERADIGFFAVDPLRGAGIGFTDAYLLIEGCYLVRDDAPYTRIEEVDRAGTRVVVGQGSAYDLFLSRALQAAEIVRAPSSQAVVETFLARGLEVAAGVRQPLEAEAAQHGGLRLLPGRFMEIRQAMGLPAGRGEAARQALADFVEAMKAEGFVAQALARHGVQGATVAPPAG